MKPKMIAAALALAACTSGPASLKELETAHDWQHEPGDQLQKAFQAGATSILKPMSRPDALSALREAGYECIFGEGSDTYPDPAAQCTRSFATRACQMDWEIFSTAAKGRVDEVTATFRRDCVGLDDDWPDKKASPIDDQLAPAQPPSTPGPAAPN